MGESSTAYRVYKYRLYPSKAQTRNLFRVLIGARHLYNMVLAERRYAWEFERRNVTIKELYEIGKHYRAKMPYGEHMSSQMTQDVVRRVDKAFQAFFRRVQTGQAPGFPRFKKATRYNSFTFPGYGNGVKIDGRRLRLFGIGRVAVRWHRPLGGKIKTTHILHRAGQWFACFTCEVPQPEPLPKTGRVVGIDVGLTALITTSDGDKVDHPRYYRDAQKRLRVLQRSLERKAKRSRNRRKALLKVQRQQMHVGNQRRDFMHKLSFTLVQHFDLIALENLRIANLSRNNRLSKSIFDAGWGIFKELLTSKAESAGRDVVFVDPAYTSKTCSNCGSIFENLTLADRWVDCECGLSLDRDHNAAINILKRI